MTRRIESRGGQASPKRPRALSSIRHHLLAGLATTILLAGGVGGWAATTAFSGAVIAPGILVVDSHVKKVQHPTGGVVGELRVREGDNVRAGDVVLRLDETITRVNLAIITKRLDELGARQARLDGERDGAPVLTFPPALLARADEPEMGKLLAGEQKLFELRRTGLQGQKAQLRERVGQFKEQIQGVTEQVTAKSREITLIKQELEGVRELWRKNLVPLHRVNGLERDLARIEGERGALIAQAAQTKGRITETELQNLQVDQELRIEVGKELAEVRAKVSELAEREVTAQDQLARIDLRAPQDGTVHQLAVHTVGGVVAPGETVMLVVPASDLLTVEAKVMPQNIDEVQVGQAAVLRMSAFNQRTTPELNGEVTRVSADLNTDPRTGATYYTMQIMIPKQEIERLKSLRLAPGMPVEAFIKTSDRTVLSYFTKPLADQAARAFRGE